MRLLLIALILLLAGCATGGYEHKTFDPATGKMVSCESMQYRRLGNQQLSGFGVDKAGPDLKIKLDGQASETQALSEAVGVIGRLVAPSRR